MLVVCRPNQVVGRIRREKVDMSTNGRAVTLSVRVKGLTDVGCHGTCEALKAR